MKRIFGTGLLLVGLLGLCALADPPAELDYQGKILVSDIPLTGPGYFKYAIDDLAGTVNYWAHDGTASGEPATYLTNDCYNGVFNVRLGAAPMTAIDPDIFQNGNDLYLRIWFSEDQVTFNEMLPAQKLVSAPYAVNSDRIDGYDADELIAAATNAFTETDPVYSSSDAAGVTASDISNWNAAYGWGDHSSVGYLTAETDPIFGASAAAGITAGHVLNWNAAFGWGDHALAGYLTAEADPVWTASSNNFYTKGEAESRYVNVTGDTMTGTLVMNVGLNNDLIISSAGRTIGIGNNTGVGIGNDRIAVGREVTNFVDNTARIRGTFWMDGGTGLVARPVFGTGGWKTLAPIPPFQHVIYVATNGTPGGPGNIDRPFDNPQNGYNYAAVTFTNDPVALVIAAGAYGGLNMNAGNIHILGQSRAQLDTLTVSSPARIIMGKQRVESLCVKNAAIVAADLGEDVKFDNCRFERGLTIYGPDVEVQDCYASAMDGSAITVGDGVNTIQNVALYNSSLYNESGVMGTLLVNPSVGNFEVVGCQIVNGALGICIEDREVGPIVPVHLYSHNVIRGMPPAPASVVAVLDQFAAGTTIAFVQNTVLGHVGISAHPQYYANNIVYGRINNIGGAGTPGWAQAGAGVGADASNNTEHQGAFPVLPSSWSD
ncbi:MAG TPA: hypothetical protein P5567_13770 [Kiritimatiellia bacterium]|nr:hypothetical protein [Kiritimatiellia bacterium]HRZ13509.1 hypothetical protein [Kiritimatiellia bacterium]HSA19186.1 hypothetical protein [Kiritimatiellia bacterium]